MSRRKSALAVSARDERAYVRPMASVQHLWSELLQVVLRTADEMAKHDEEQAVALLSDYKFLQQRATRHLRRAQFMTTNASNDNE
jgi:hypothetical protein